MPFIMAAIEVHREFHEEVVISSPLEFDYVPLSPVNATPATRQPLPPNISAALIVNPELSCRVVLGTTLLRPHTHAIAAISELIRQLGPPAFRHSAGVAAPRA